MNFCPICQAEDSIFKSARLEGAVLNIGLTKGVPIIVWVCLECGDVQVKVRDMAQIRPYRESGPKHDERLADEQNKPKQGKYNR